MRQSYEGRTTIRRQAAIRMGAADNEEKHLGITHAYVPGDLVLTYITDITEQIQAEAEILRYQKQLSSLYEKQVDIIEHERKRISQELHDGLGQYLSTIKVSAENLLVNNGAGIDRRLLDDQLRSTIALLKEAITDVSKISMDLRPSILDDLGIVATINWFLREFSKVYTNIRVDKDLSVEDAQIPQPIKIVAFRVLQEAMSNIAQHSAADQAQICMRKAGETLEFVIRDNGRGFDATELQKSCSGLGIAGMRERVSFSRGVFTVESNKGKGTVVRVCWPLTD
jgi:signal transduction histidine kinase